MPGKHEQPDYEQGEVMADQLNPLKEVAAKIGTAWAAVAGVLGATVSFGVLSAAQADAINAAGTAIPGSLVAIGTVVGAFVPLVGAIIASFHTANAGANHVTPVANPRNNLGQALVPVGSIAPATGAHLADQGDLS